MVNIPFSWLEQRQQGGKRKQIQSKQEQKGGSEKKNMTERSVGRGEIRGGHGKERKMALGNNYKPWQWFWCVILFACCVKVGVKQRNGLIGLLSRLPFLLLRTEYRKTRAEANEPVRHPLKQKQQWWRQEAGIEYVLKLKPQGLLKDRK